MTLLTALAIRSGVVLAAGLLLSGALATRSAALRHRVLAAALLASILVMPLGAALPEWNVTLPARASAARPVVTAAPASAAEVSGVAVPPAPASAVSPIVAIWFTGAFALAAALAVSLLRVRRVAARASAVADPRWLHALDTIAGRYGLRRRIVLARTDSDNLLATWGLLRPQVLLPRHSTDWALDRVDVVLCHELAHIRRHDWLVQMAAEGVRAVLWFNPLAWIVCRRLRRESEQACDDEVLGMGVGGRVYATHLIDLARQCRRPRSAWAPVLPMAHPSTLERRIAAMLNSRLDRRAPSWRAVAGFCAVLVLVTVPVAALRARPAGPTPLTGTIYDVTGGVMPGVEVSLVDANQLTAVVSTDAAGHFLFPAVAPGKYTLEVAVPGFRTLRQEFELQNARDWDRAVTLQVGELRETVTIRSNRVTATAPAAAPRAGAGPVRIGGNVRPPRKLVDVRAVYPESMRQAGLSGVVPLEAVIGQDGSVTSVRVLSAQVHPDFAIAAVDAVRQWRFSPTLLNGTAVEVVMTVSVRFDLED
jgi:TonB family protein